MFLVHPKPENDEQTKMLRNYQRCSDTPDTWKFNYQN